MRMFDWQQLSEAERRVALARPVCEVRADVAAVALEVVSAVRKAGDSAVRAFTKRFDGVQLESFGVSRAEFEQARDALTAAQHAALEKAIENVHRFHAAQLPTTLSIDTMPGVRCERGIRPIAAVGLYVPGGSLSLKNVIRELRQRHRAQFDCHDAGDHC